MEIKITERTLNFSVRIVKLVTYLRKNKKLDYSISSQILRCGTSIGANVHESQGAQSNADFIAKMHIALKEARETEYWLLLIFHSKIISEKQYHSLNTDLNSILAILTAIIKTTKNKL